MIPLHDENPTSSTAWVTIMLIVINVAAFAYEISLASTGTLNAFVQEWAFVPARFFASPLAPHELATVFVAMFLHGGILHVAGNMLYLWIFGNNVEDRLGWPRYLAFYLMAGIAATIGQGLVDPANSVPNLGASGAIAGVLGAYLLLYPRARVLTAVIIIFFIELVRIPAVLVIGLWFLLQLATGLFSLGAVGTRSGGVAYFAHVFGFAAGALMAAPLLVADRSRRTRFVGWR